MSATSGLCIAVWSDVALSVLQLAAIGIKLAMDGNCKSTCCGGAGFEHTDGDTLSRLDSVRNSVSPVSKSMKIESVPASERPSPPTLPSHPGECTRTHYSNVEMNQFTLAKSHSAGSIVFDG